MTSKLLSALFLGLAAGTLPLSGAPQLSFTDEGLHVENGSMGGFTLEYPALVWNGSQAPYKIIEKSPGTVRYEGGAGLTAAVLPDGPVTYTFGRGSGWRNVKKKPAPLNTASPTGTAYKTPCRKRARSRPK